MSAPREFESFCNQIFFAMKYNDMDPKQWILAAKNETSPNALRVVHQYLEDIAASEMSIMELQSQWNTWQHRFGVAIDGDLREFLVMVRDIIR